MGDQALEITKVKKFIDEQIDNAYTRETMRQSLKVLTDSLDKRGVTFEEVIEHHISKLNAVAERKGIQVDNMTPRTLDKYKNRFRDVDIAKIIECSSNLMPLLDYQKRVKEDNKRKYKEKVEKDKELQKIDTKLRQVHKPDFDSDEERYLLD